MLAAKFDNEKNIEPELAKLTFPLLGSPKIDGFRWMKPYGQPMMSRSWKPLPNKRVQAYVSDQFAFLDGEVIVGDKPWRQGVFNDTQSAIMTADDQRPFSLWIFDNWVDHLAPFSTRTSSAQRIVSALKDEGFSQANYVEHVYLNDIDEVLNYEKFAIEAGYEGIMLRSPSAPYKFGRSTLKQQGLIKVKRFQDDEAVIVGYEALERNQNPQVRDAFGLAKRSSHQSGKVADSLLGKLIVRNERFGNFAIGSGFDIETRQDIWNNKEKYLGRAVSFKYQAHGTLEKPRMPIWKGFRPKVE
jgi:DNA ligase-1